MKFTSSLFRSVGLLSFVLAALAPLGRANQEPDAQRILDGKLSPTLHVVHIDHRFGPVTVVGVDQDFGWRWVLTCTGDRAQAEAVIKESHLEVLETNGTLEMRFVPADRDNLSYHGGGSLTVWKLFRWAWNGANDRVGMNSTLELRVPHAVTLELKNRFGHVTASDLRGPVNLDCQHANLDVALIEGALTAVTSFARTKVEHTGPALLRSQNGEIHVSHVDGDLRATSSFAKVRVQDVKGRAELKNENGEIEASEIAGDLVAASSFARIFVRDVKGRADLHNQNGRIDAGEVRRGLAAESSFAEVHVEDIDGAVLLRCQNGRVDAHRIAGGVIASNSFAPLRVEDVSGDAQLESQNGEISARGVTGDVSAKTSFARIQIDGEGKRFDARNQNGAVQITARSPTVERIAATTSFGPIDVSLPPDCKPLIRANTSFGKIRSEFPVVLNDTASEASFSGTLPKVTLHGKNGDIRVSSAR